MAPTDKNPGDAKDAQEGEAVYPPDIDKRLMSQDKRIAYLINRLAKIERKDIEFEAPVKTGLTDMRMGELKRVLLDHGLEIAGFNEKGIVRLKPVNGMGFDTLRKLNTLFHIDTLETYFEQYLR